MFRLLEETGAALERAGRPQLRLEPARRSLGSLVPLIGDPPDSMGLDQVRRQAGAELARWRAGGGVLLVEDEAKLDSATRRALAATRALGGRLSSGPSGSPGSACPRAAPSRNSRAVGRGRP